MVVAVAESAGLDVEKAAFVNVSLRRQCVLLGSFRWGCRIGYGGCCSGIGWLGCRERSVFQHFFRASVCYVRQFSLGVPH